MFEESLLLKKSKKYGAINGILASVYIVLINSLQFSSILISTLNKLIYLFIIYTLYYIFITSSIKYIKTGGGYSRILLIP